MKGAAACAPRLVTVAVSTVLALESTSSAQPSPGVAVYSHSLMSISFEPPAHIEAFKLLNDGARTSERVSASYYTPSIALAIFVGRCLPPNSQVGFRLAQWLLKHLALGRS